MKQMFSNVKLYTNDHLQFEFTAKVFCKMALKSVRGHEFKSQLAVFRAPEEITPEMKRNQLYIKTIALLLAFIN